MAVNGAQSDVNHGRPKRKKVVVVGLGMVGVAFVSVLPAIHRPSHSDDNFQRKALET